MERTYPREAGVAQVAFRATDSARAQKMAAAQTGDTAAYRALLEEVRVSLIRFYDRSLKRYGIHTSASVEDLTQETLLAIHQKRQTYDPSQPFGPWMFAIARYKLIDHGRKSRREITLDDWTLIEETVAAVGEGDTSSESFVHSDLVRLMSSLSEKPREILDLVKLQEIPVKDVARRLGMTESAIKVTVHRAIRAVKDALKTSE